MLDMMDFDVILGMDWLSHYYAIMDFFAKITTLAMADITFIVWKKVISCKLIRVIFYIQDRRLILKTCKSYLTYIRDVSMESSSLDSIPMFYQFPDAFPADLPCLTLECDIQIIIYLEPGTQLICMVPYHVFPA